MEKHDSITSSVLRVPEVWKRSKFATKPLPSAWVHMWAKCLHKPFHLVGTGRWDRIEKRLHNPFLLEGSCTTVPAVMGSVALAVFGGPQTQDTTKVTQPFPSWEGGCGQRGYPPLAILGIPESATNSESPTQRSCFWTSISGQLAELPMTFWGSTYYRQKRMCPHNPCYLRVPHRYTKWLHYPRSIGGTRNRGAIENGFMAFAISEALEARSNQTWPHHVGPLEQEDLSDLEEPVCRGAYPKGLRRNYEMVKWIPFRTPSVNPFVRKVTLSLGFRTVFGVGFRDPRTMVCLFLTTPWLPK